MRRRALAQRSHDPWLCYVQPAPGEVMPLDPAALPLLMAGPVLRRVESDLVSVWIATSRRCDVSLLLFDGADVIAPENPSPENASHDLRARWISASQSTLQVGAHLHVLTVVLDLRSPDGNAVLSRGPLEANATYSYDLQLVVEGDAARTHNLRSLELLEDPIPLGYNADELPSFRMPPLEPGNLVIVHGSCRQLFAVPPVEDDPEADDPDFRPPPDWPTEEPTPDRPVPPPEPDAFPEDQYPRLPKRDGMLWVDALIDQRGPGPKIAGRPHQLFLTGDQIYADQVPEPLLPVLNNLARILVGAEDLGANPAGDLFKPADLLNFPPGFRQDIVIRSAGFTTSAGSSHLLSFGEFIAYYLLTWSPELWSVDAAFFAGDEPTSKLWPDGFVPSAIPIPEDWRVRFLFEDDSPEAEFTDAFLELRAKLREDDSPLTEPDEQAAFFFGQRRDWIASKYLSPELFE
jgi:hypothetical protein